MDDGNSVFEGASDRNSLGILEGIKDGSSRGDLVGGWLGSFERITEGFDVVGVVGDEDSPFTTEVAELGTPVRDMDDGNAVFEGASDGNSLGILEGIKDSSSRGDLVGDWLGSFERITKGFDDVVVVGDEDSPFTTEVAELGASVRDKDEGNSVFEGESDGSSIGSLVGKIHVNLNEVGSSDPPSGKESTSEGEADGMF